MAARKKWLLATLVLSAFLFTAGATVRPDISATTDVYPSPPLIAMPEEYINYTIASVNGSLWAKIDGVYPLHVIYGPEQEYVWDGTSYKVVSGPLALVYPTPPGTTNIVMKMNETELVWGNYTEIYPEARHHTALGDWSMVNCTIYAVPEYFTLKIHYEHPLVLINESYVFLYDLNISPYLSPWSNKSTAYFTIRMETNYTNLHLNAIATDEILTPINYSVNSEDAAETVTFQIVSEYSKPLLGDILVSFTAPKASGAVAFSYLLIFLPIAVIAVLIVRIAYRRKQAGTRLGK
jgi:hypothetical protein